MNIFLLPLPRTHWFSFPRVRVEHLAARPVGDRFAAMGEEMVRGLLGQAAVRVEELAPMWDTLDWQVWHHPEDMDPSVVGEDLLGGPLSAVLTPVVVDRSKRAARRLRAAARYRGQRGAKATAHQIRPMFGWWELRDALRDPAAVAEIVEGGPRFAARVLADPDGLLAVVPPEVAEVLVVVFAHAWQGPLPARLPRRTGAGLVRLYRDGVRAAAEVMHLCRPGLPETGNGILLGALATVGGGSVAAQVFDSDEDLPYGLVQSVVELPWMAPAVGAAIGRRPDLPASLMRRVATCSSSAARCALAGRADLPGPVVELLCEAAFTDVALREVLLRRGDGGTGFEALLLNREDVRTQALLAQHGRSGDVLAILWNRSQDPVRRLFAENVHAPQALRDQARSL
jgi:hypothetical protein